MIATYNILTCKFDADQNIWFTPLAHKGSSQHQSDQGSPEPQKKGGNQFSIRVVPVWNSLPDHVKNQITLNSLKNAYDNRVQT